MRYEESRQVHPGGRLKNAEQVSVFSGARSQKYQAAYDLKHKQANNRGLEPVSTVDLTQCAHQLFIAGETPDGDNVVDHVADKKHQQYGERRNAMRHAN